MALQDTMLKIPYFSKGSLELLETHLEKGIYKDLDRIIMHYINEGDYNGQFVLVDADKTIYYLRDIQTKSNVDSAKEASTEALDAANAAYALAESFEERVTALEEIDISTKLSEINTEIDSLDNRVNTLEEIDISTKLSEMNTEIDNLDTRVTAIEDLNISDRLDSIDSSVSTLSESTTEHTTSINTMNNQISDINDDIQTIQDEMSVLFV